MALIDLGSSGLTHLVGVSDAPATFTTTKLEGVYVIYSERNIHIRVDLDASTGDFLLAQGDYARLRLMNGQTISLVIADGDSDGNAWITEAA